MKKIFKSLAGNTIIFAIGNSATLIISFIMVPIYTSILSTSEFGISDIINTTISMLLPVISLNIFSAVFRWSLDMKDNEEEIFSNGLLITLIGSLISIIIGVVLLILNFKYFWAIGIDLGGMLLLSHFQNFARGINQIKLFSLSGVISAIINLISNYFLMIMFNFGLTGYLISLIISTYLSTLFIYYFGRHKKYWNRKKISKSGISEMLRYSIPMIPNAFTWWLTNDASRILILMFVGSGGNGLYAVSTKIPSLITTLFGLFQNAWQITAVEIFNSKERNNIYSLIFNAIFSILLLGSIVVVSIIKSFMYFYVSTDFFNAWRFIPILILTAIFSSISSFLGTTYLAAKETKGLFTTTVWGMVINLVISFILIPFFGVNGAGMSGMLGFFIVSCIRLKQTEKWVKIKIRWGLHLPLIISYILMSVIIYINDSLLILKTIIIIISTIIVYLYFKKNILSSIKINR